ncbi:hypothetical protein PR202_gb21035 [Eleusine coracana subsp. coracana]|uniref:Fungal lipase-like domain-containing protein n=1 Tax=Eleusine coracana subsp. coracana TaxID=191504 RepID=A0AAV5FE44_ELECO|nr:hypothetical protein PR202_gb21035 [Eleusine coracana subsp. coracana]
MMARTGAVSSVTTRDEINWDDDDHRRCIAAGLVQRTYNMEKDRTKGRRLNRQGSFLRHFSLVETLRECRLKCKCHRDHQQGACPFCNCKMSPCFIYGAIFEYVPPQGTRHRHSSSAPPPRYIVAFRGTMPTDTTAIRDFYLDVNVVLNRQHDCLRFSHARERVWKLLDDAADSVADIWLAGHSLGASIALDVGRDMAMGGCYLRTLLFNPPQVSLAPAAGKLNMAEEAKRDLYFTSYLVKQVLGETVLRRHKKHAAVLFEQLSPWVPELYVHQRDVICNGFIDYFQLRELAKQRFPRFLARSSAPALAYRDSMVHLLCAELGFRETNELPHLLPSARLWINSSTEGDSHELRQWCQPRLARLSSNLYTWP